VGSDAPSDYHVAPRSENPAPTGGSAPAAHVGAPPPTTVAPAAATPALPGKKKRGRPRKYGLDGSVTMALSPKPISSSAPPPVIDFSSEKRGKVKPASSVTKTKFEVENIGNGKNVHRYVPIWDFLSDCVLVLWLKLKRWIFGVYVCSLFCFLHVGFWFGFVVKLIL